MKVGKKTNATSSLILPAACFLELTYPSQYSESVAKTLRTKVSSSDAAFGRVSELGNGIDCIDR